MPLGRIGIKDLDTVMKSLGTNVSERELQDMISEADSSNSGSLDFEGISFLNLSAWWLFSLTPC